ncbi:hypothetical protein Tsubulata_049291 [Turnera subulata]|uniref:Uncharacterized protein n=1 Tax=Turnera subulata TaxID=218843 RepID=A0A9Q0FHA3_9ROSI|nr:hypothetical protein Tsubulata_049291 [Turnera subulata]
MAAAADTASASAQDPIEGKRQNISATAGNGCTTDGEQSKTALRLKELYSFASDHMPKVRKPYTITKQREKWTEEEHQRFLEALRLYGRGWRKIQEHVGTKTAVQIRSHAQKFFSKVARESSGGSETSVEPIEIPPPRPKRKPMHPYPRKSVDVLDGTSVSNQLERSPSPNLMVSEKENLSPTSVLSVAASDAASPLSEQRNGYSSPPSCTTDVHSSSLLPIKKENEHLPSLPSREQEKRHLSPVQSSSAPALEKFLSMKFESDAKDGAIGKGDANAVAPFGSIKLFGKTVLVTDCQKPSVAETEPLLSVMSKMVQENPDVDREKQGQALPQRQLDTQLTLGPLNNKTNAFPSGTSVYPCMELQGESSNTSGTNPPIPWWSFCQGLPLMYISSSVQASPDNSSPISVVEGLAKNEIVPERSSTGSNAGSTSESENRERNLDAVDSQSQQQSVERSSSVRKCTKGFVPYKRCLEERDEKSTALVMEAREHQRARVCS